MKHKLIVISLDALQTCDLDLLETLPYASRWLPDAAIARNVHEVYPTLTYPIHTTLITGVYPETHGIIHNQKASISPTVPDFSLMGSDWYWQKENVKVPTLVDAIFADGRMAASVNWPVTAGDMRGWNLPEIWPVKELGDDPRAVYEKSASRNVFDRYYDAYVGHYNWKNNDDLLTYAGEIAIDIIEKEKPDLMLYHAVHLDHIRHKYGDMAEETVDCLKTLDILVHRIIEATKRNGTYEDTNFVILGDHGQIDIDAVFYINNALRDAGLIQVDENGTPVAYDAYAFSAGFSAHVYLRDPSDPELVKKVDAILHGLQKAFPQYIERVYTKEEATHLEHLTGAFSFVLEGTFGTILQTAVNNGPYVRLSSDPNFKGYGAMHGHHPDKGPKPPFIAFGPDVKKGVRLDGVSMLDLCPTMAKLAGVQMEGMVGKPLPFFND